MKIKYVTGDATRPIGDGKKIIAHCCNNENKWGSGFVLALSKRWDAPEECYRALTAENRKLGNVQLVQVTEDISVANMIGQEGIRPDASGKPPIRYEAIRECLKLVNSEALRYGATLHCPKFGAGLSGGDWNIIEKIILDEIKVDVYVYLFNCHN